MLVSEMGTKEGTKTGAAGLGAASEGFEGSCGAVYFGGVEGMAKGFEVESRL